MFNIPQIVQDKCPVWSGRIKEQSLNELGEFQGNVSIGSSNHCIVGEAHGWAEKYWYYYSQCIDNDKGACEECTEYSLGFYRVIRHENGTPKIFQSLLDDFGDHLEACHNEKENVEKEMVPQLPMVIIK